MSTQTQFPSSRWRLEGIQSTQNFIQLLTCAQRAWKIDSLNKLLSCDLFLTPCTLSCDFGCEDRLVATSRIKEGLDTCFFSNLRLPCLQESKWRVYAFLGLLGMNFVDHSHMGAYFLSKTILTCDQNHVAAHLRILGKLGDLICRLDSLECLGSLTRGPQSHGTTFLFQNTLNLRRLGQRNDSPLIYIC